MVTHLRRMRWKANLFTPGDDIFSSVCAKKKFLWIVTQESVITNSKQLMRKKSADSFKDNNGNRIGIS